jgi:8-oxo-dGTP pyrophosphatase MutT (NUDIX family)
MRYDQLRVEKAVSAGGVVFRHGDRGGSGLGIEIVLCGRTAERLWALPKGTPEAGESLEETALREVSEETGLGVRIVESLGTIDYEFARASQGVRFEKTVHHYLMEPSGEGSVESHDHEYDRVAWFEAGEALRIMTYRSELEVVRRALDVIEHGEMGSAAGAAL